MYCPSCGAWNPDDSRFCGKCGRPVQTAGGARARFGGDGARARGGLCLATLVASVLLALGILAVGAFVLRDQLGSIWPRPAITPTDVTVSITPSATTALAESTRTPLPSTSPTEAQQSITPPPVATATLRPTPELSPTPAPTPTSAQRSFSLVYRGCTPHGQSLGSVKGQVLDKSAQVIPGAKIRITVDGYDWQSDANPATTNADGWYEWILQVGQKVRFVELTVDGRAALFSPQDLEVEATGGCFHRVDFIEQ